MDRNTLAATLAADLVEAEKLTNAAFGAQARLAATLSRVQSEGELALKVGADAVTLVAGSMGKLAGAREDLAEAHDRLAVWARKFRMQVSPDVGGGEKPPAGQGIDGRPPLAAVA